MAKTGYYAASGAAVALVAATAKTVLTVMGPATFGVDLKKLDLSFDGVTGSAVPVVVEVCAHSGATAGTSTAGTMVQQYGRVLTASFTTAYNFTAEPTVLTVIRRWLLSPNSTTFAYDWPLGDTPDSGVSSGFALRITAPAAVNCWAGFSVERS